MRRPPLSLNQVEANACAKTSFAWVHPLNQAEHNGTPSIQKLSLCFCVLALICKNVKLQCPHAPWQPQAGFGMKPGPVQVSGVAGVGGRGTRPGHLEGLVFALAANSLDKDTGTWARDVLSPERRQAGTAGPLFQR